MYRCPWSSSQAAREKRGAYVEGAVPLAAKHQRHHVDRHSPLFQPVDLGSISQIRICQNPRLHEVCVEDQH
jgi:hypothetical protein